ncbi:thymidine kinase, cytosolic-like isoform X2 [Gigantopelta aegis]|uniref:thymidine kinase, cytosolic-like isoform X2 n=1 Tax=Gigantopelta aegis TaxID=1735272 RepID=UPI001B88D5BD|nr:thymidine kinase, cytosolic-like isoform X2 [Gigantopelta aegis]
MMSSSHLIPSFAINDSRRGQIQVIFGPMFSGKTTELMRRMKRYQIANYNCLIIKYSKDDRYDKDGIATHDRQTLPAVSAEELSTLSTKAIQYDVIGIDEGQFFPDVVEFCNQLAEKGKVVIVAALDGTFQKQGFGNILNLVPVAEHVTKLTAVCMTCYSEASFTKRKGSETKVEVIGGADKYLAVCRMCFQSPEKESPRKRSPLREINTSLQRSLQEKNAANRKLFLPTEIMH